MKLSLPVVLILIAITTVTSCNSKEDKAQTLHFNGFNKTINFDSVSFTAPSINGLCEVWDIANADSFLILGDVRDVNGYIKVINKQNYKQVAQFAKQGNGPNEYINPGILSYDKASGNIWFLDGPKHQCISFSIDKAISQADPMPRKTVTIDPFLAVFSSFHALADDNLIISSNADSTSLYTVISPDGNIKKTLGEGTNKWYDGMNLVSYNMFYNRFSVINESKELAISAYNYFDKVELCNLKNGSVRVLHTTKSNAEVKPIIGEDGFNIYNERCTYMYAAQWDGYVFFSYLGGNFFNAGANYNLPKEIHVFDWELNPIAKMEFPFEIQSFAIDSKNIYLITNEEKQLVIYPFSNEMLK